VGPSKKPAAMAPPLDAIIIGAGPSGLAASIALSGWRPHVSASCSVVDAKLSRALKDHLRQTPSGLLTASSLPKLANGLKGRSNYPLALLFDALQHPGVDQGMRGMPSCLELQHDAASSVRHVMIDPAPPGGSWHRMHDATLTLSPGPWMELPGFSLANFIHPRPADLRQPRSLIASYYEAAAQHFDVARHHVQERAVAIHYAAEGGGGADADAAAWTVELEHSPPLRAHSLILAIGTSGKPQRLGVIGEELPFVSHKCTEPLPRHLASESAAATTNGTGTVLVVGAGLSAADCIVHHLRKNRHVVHAFRGAAEATKVGSKFGGAGSRGFYPEYFALSQAMMNGAHGTRRTDPISLGDPISLLGGRYEALPSAELQAIRPDGTCELGGASSAAAGPPLSVAVDAVAILIGATPALDFLPPEVLAALEERGPPPNTIDGVKATHRPVTGDRTHDLSRSSCGDAHVPCSPRRSGSRLRRRQSVGRGGKGAAWAACARPTARRQLCAVCDTRLPRRR
jgi:hypothetical protein